MWTELASVCLCAVSGVPYGHDSVGGDRGGEHGGLLPDHGLLHDPTRATRQQAQGQGKGVTPTHSLTHTLTPYTHPYIHSPRLARPSDPWFLCSCLCALL